MNRTFVKAIFAIGLISVLLPGLVYSQQSLLTKDEAQDIARSFTSMVFTGTKSSLKMSSAIELKESNTIVLYAFNIKNGGYVLVSSTKDAMPVPAFSKHGSFIKGSLPPAADMWIDSYKKQIYYAISAGSKGNDEIKNAWEILENKSQQRDIVQKDIEPLLISTWNQGVPYNAACPADPAGQGGHCVTGCVATTMAQLLYYFRFPEQGVGSYTYVHPVYDTISADFSNAFYEYDKMLNMSVAPNEEMAELSFHPGVAVDMVYGPSGSGMYNHKAAYALRTYFKLSPQTEYVYRDSTTMDWDSLLVTHLDNKIPMYYAGWSVPDISGHAFICDGYQVNTLANYYHFNWGWGGSYDGYFYTDDLTPGGSLFNLAQELIINGYPDTALYIYPEYCQGQSVLNGLYGTIDDGSGPANDYENNTSCSWLIQPQVSPYDSIDHITLNFGRLDTEANTDIVSIYSGPSTASPLIGTYSGATLPATIISQSEEVFITFTSDSISEFDGFFISYEVTFPEYCDNLTTINDTAGNVSDGSGNKYYTNNTLCRWLIAPPNAQSLKIEFNSFSTEANKDILYVYDYVSQILLGQFSGGQLPPDIIAPGGSAYLEFITNNNITDQGWKASFYALYTGINENLMDEDLNVYPNPADDVLFISMPGYVALHLSLLTIEGRMIIDRNINSGNNGLTELDISTVEDGTYILSVKTAKGIAHQKVIIRR